MLALLLLPLLWGGSLQKDPEDQLQESLTVQEGLCALVPCSFSYPWTAWDPLYISWFREGDRKPVATDNPVRTQKEETQGRFYLLGNFRTKTCSLHISDARMADTGRYFFQVERGTYGQRIYQDKLLNLQVTALTEKPTIHVPESLESGQPTSLRCSLPGSCGGGQRLTFSWKGDALRGLDSRTLRSSMLTLTPMPQDHGTSLTCRVKLERAEVTTERTVYLNVTYAPHNVTISTCFSNATVLKVLQNTSSLYILEGQALRLLCAADSKPPAELSWFRGSPPLNATPISSNASLELPQVGPEEEGGLTCQARNPLGSRNVSLSLYVLYSPRLLGPSCSWEAQGLRCSCSSRARPAPSLRWRLGEQLLEGNSSDASFTVTSSSAGPWANGSLSLRGPLISDLRLSCEARNAHGGAQSLVVLLLPGKPESRTGVVPAALAGAGAASLLSLCLCLLFFCIVKACRKGAAGRRKAMDDEDPVMGTVAWGSRKKSWPDTPPDQVSPAGGAPPSGEQQELHYASFTFHGMKMRESQATEYSEVKASK